VRALAASIAQKLLERQNASYALELIHSDDRTSL